MKRKYRGKTLICGLLFLGLLLTGIHPAYGAEIDVDVDLSAIRNLFGKTTVTCDIEENPAYQNFSVTQICTDLEANYKKAVLTYRHQYISVSGVVLSVSANAEKLELGDLEGGTGSITVKTEDASLIRVISGLSAGNRVRVCGKALIDSVLEKRCTVTADLVEKTEQTGNRSSTVYCFRSGRSYDAAACPERELPGQIRFRIPAAWEGVEEEISKEAVTGWLYRLNEIPEDFRTSPEQAYVFYFDNEKGLKDLSDRDASPEDIERAIIRNILPYDRASSYPTRKITVENGPDYRYYVTSYEDTGLKYHNVEFIFTENGTDGIFCVMYLFDDSVHKEDVIFLLRTLKNNENG